MKTILLALASVIALVGCDGEPTSDEVELGDVYASYVLAKEDGKLPVATAQLREGGPSGSALVLGGGDTISCGGAMLVRTDSDGVPAYSAVLPAAATSAEFELVRPGQRSYVRHADMPPALRITSAPTSASYDSQLDISWASDASQAGTITIEATSTNPSCPKVTVADHVKDTGTWAFDGSAFRPSKDEDVECAYTVAVMHDVESDVGPPFVGGVLVSRSLATAPIQFHVP
ncbi:MAG TPA: hypothetical protein VF407_16850 [Polyangiaceae bacterium]